MISLILGISVGFLLMAGLRLGMTGFHFTDPALLGVVLNIMQERQKRGMSWENPLYVSGYLRRIYICVALVVPALIIIQTLVSYWVP